MPVVIMRFILNSVFDSRGKTRRITAVGALDNLDDYLCMPKAHELKTEQSQVKLRFLTLKQHNF